MNRLTPILCIIVATGVAVLDFPQGFVSLFIAGLATLAVCLFIRRKFDTDTDFLTHVFILAMLARLALGTFIYVFEQFEFFGPDAIFYDSGARALANLWSGTSRNIDPEVLAAIRGSGVGYGMHHLAAGIYFVAGHSMLHVQAFLAVIGAAVVPAIYYCAQQMFANRRVARFAAIGVAFFPSFIIWSSQLLKDGIILFLIVLSICMVYSLQKKLNLAAAVVLLGALGGIVSLRFYIFFMIAAAVVGSFLIGIGETTVSMARRLAVLFVIAIIVAYSGVWENAARDFSTYGTFERLRVSRQYASKAAGSGFDANIKSEIASPLDALSVVPVGLAYLLFAPFPWQVTNFRQSITLPETFLWWSLLPLGLWGLWYTIRNRLRAAIPVLVFTGLLTLSYSVYQGNVGTAYRQRTQIQVFLFVFIAAGFTMLLEKREDRKLVERNARMRQRIGGPHGHQQIAR